MGPDCGTAIVNGVPLGFANVVRRGDIGLVAASGTGSAGGHLPHPQPGRRHFAGARHRRPRPEGGDRRHHDAAGARCARRRSGDARDRADLQAARRRRSPAQIAGRGGAAGQARRRALSRRGTRAPAPAGLFAAASLRHAADVAVALARGEPAPASAATPADAALAAVDTAARPRWRRRSAPCARCSPAARSATRRSSRSSRAACACRSNAPADGARPFDGRFDGHVFLDLGDDDYTRGRPHPMIDPTLRNAAVRTQGADPQTAAILFDVVLGFGCARRPRAADSRRRWPTRSARRARKAARSR